MQRAGAGYLHLLQVFLVIIVTGAVSYRFLGSFSSVVDHHARVQNNRHDTSTARQSGLQVSTENSRRGEKTGISTGYPAPVPPKRYGNRSTLALTVPFTGRLGNQMFQYASLLGIAHLNGRRPYYSPYSFLPRYFTVTHTRVPLPPVKYKVLSEKNFAAYDPSFERLPEEDIRLVRYLQSWKYFHSIRERVKAELTFRPKIKAAVARLLLRHQHRTGNRTYVGVHVRRGDLLAAVSRAKGYYTAPASYVLKAMKHMRREYADAIFLVVTDDPVWCKAELKAEAEYILIDPAPAEVHLALLASCHHVIMTVGTFGWWGGYLCGGSVVYYWDLNCLHQPPMPVELRTPGDFYLPHWTPLPA